MTKPVLIKIGGMKFNLVPVLYALAIAPFFEPFSINMLIDSGIHASLWSKIGSLYALARIAVSTYVYANVIQTRKRFKTFFTNIVKSAIIFLIMQVVSCLMNKTFTVNMLLALYSYMGFVFLCIDLQRKSPHLFIESVAVFFGIMSFLGVLTTFLYPNGFNNSDTKAYAQYLLGSKNSSFYYYFMFIYSWSAYMMLDKDRLPKGSGVCILVLIAASFVCNSSNSLICLSLLLVFNCMEKRGKWLFKYAKPKLMFTAIVVIGLVVYTGRDWPIVRAIVGIVGRDLTFTGRDVLWTQAIMKFVNSPIWGIGNTATFLLKSGVKATHAHSYYLDELAKHGLVTAIPLFAALYFSIKHVVRIKNRMLSNQMGAFVFVAMIHMLFDVPGNYFFLLLLMIVNAVSMTSSTQCAYNNK